MRRLSGETKIKIAITAYVDHIEAEKFADECNLMTYSGQCLDNRFTFVIYVHPEAAGLIDRYDNVKVVEYTAIENSYYSIYRFAKSLLFVYDYPDPLADFDYVIKTDTDTIFTPMMNEFDFESNKIFVGTGFYTGTEESLAQLKEVASEFGYETYERISDMHSTIVGPKQDIIDAMRASDDLCRRMYYYLPEPGEWHGKSLWRGHYQTNSGVCSMYATEIVLSSEPYKCRVEVIGTIDASSNLPAPWTDFYHYHCYHHDFIYSKHQAKYGSYSEIGTQSGDSSAAYCMNLYIARRDLGRLYPERFSKPIFSVFEIPYPDDKKQIKYQFEKTVD